MHPRHFLLRPGSFLCYIRVSGSHLAEPVDKSDLSVVTVDCLICQDQLVCTFLTDCDSLVTRLQKVPLWFVGSGAGWLRRARAVSGCLCSSCAMQRVQGKGLPLSSLPLSSHFLSAYFYSPLLCNATKS